MSNADIDRILDKLAKDVEAAVHALYRGEVRQQTARARTDHLLRDARDRIAQAVKEAGAPNAPNPVVVSPRPSVSAPAVAGAALGWSPEEGAAVLKCITAWLPLGSPRDAAPESKCVAAGRELVPTWGERERARGAVKRVT